MRVLVTRAKAQADATAARLTALGHAPFVAPLQALRFREKYSLSLEGAQAFLVTSANGVEALARNTPMRTLPVYAVGNHTAGAAKALGFESVYSADGDAAALAELAMRYADPSGGELVHVSGDRIAGDLEGALTAKGFHVRRVVLYDAVAAENLPAQAAEALESGLLDAVLLFSPESARIFRFCITRASLEDACAGLLALCLSEAVAQALSPLHLRDIRIAAEPNQDALLKRLER